MSFELAKDLRTPQCEHDQVDGCYRCCEPCNYDLHKCGQCGTPMDHQGCSGSQLGWCTPCRTDHYAHEGDTDD